MSRKTAVITGPTAGIGHEFAVQLAQRGYDLVLVARNEVRLKEVAEELSSYGAASEVIVADLSLRPEMERVEERIKQGVDLLVNNAGFGHKQPFLSNSVDDEVAMLDVLVTAVLRLSHAALTTMVERGEGGVINVSSIAGELPRGTYSAAKAYVTRFSEWADLTYRDQGVRTMALLPGFTKTEFHARMEVSRDSAPSWMWLEVEDLVREALDDFDKGRTISIPSKRYKVLTAASRYTPAPVKARFQKLGRR
ncbi:MAG TPA: SDR family NAD(P)-dependent oxidoreductase [Nocardioidaceae bacterium]|nr:SDR family NAD(P)-dependent oxidoreductase [Nocardioidaceae bacterium]